ncbi:MAG: hydantoinase/oxoprolinase family protein [Acidobacteria bacterium]|nr:hydantoinase/oxoprolinase family protein [Acidobacteriota bacterium]
MGYRIGIDVGGTFTDCVAIDANLRIETAKVPTETDEAEGIFNGISLLGSHFGHSADAFLSQSEIIVLGTTVVTNTMLEYSGSPTGLITTKGFRDIIELRRGYKESMFDIRLEAPFQIVPRQKRIGVSERVDYSGRVITELNQDEVKDAVRRLKELRVESIAVCFLFSFVSPKHEKRVREIIKEIYPEAYVTLSSELLPQIREFERVSTTIVNAYVTPKLSRYLERLEAKLSRHRFSGELFIMQSNGGMMGVDYTKTRGVEAVLSGPSGGIVASIYRGQQSRQNNLITVDMGGTSYDVCLIQDAKPEIGIDAWISRYRIAIPMIDIHTIGAGGGSIAWLDQAGGLRVGPRSAGAVPGPACYMRGGIEPTVTDADLILGYLNPDYFLNGKMILDKCAAERAICRIADPLKMDIVTAAHGIFKIVNNAMTNAIRYVSISRGRDPRDYALMAFGGAGPIHAGMQVKDLGIRTIVVPRNAGVFSAIGNLVSNLKISKVHSYVRRKDQVDLDEVNALFMKMMKDAEAQLGKKEKVKEIIIERSMDVRYVGQVQEVIVPIQSRTQRVTDVNLANTFRDFHQLHYKLYAFNRPDEPPEIVNLRLDMIGLCEEVHFRSISFQGENPEKALKGKRQVYFEETGFIEVPIYDGEKVEPGNLIGGPAIIEEPWTNIVIFPKQEALLDQYMNYVVEVVT